MGLEVRRQVGVLPEFWGHSATFLANLSALFYRNRGGSAVLRRDIDGIESYGGRFIPIIDLLFRGRENLLVLERAPGAALLGYFEDELGLTLPDLYTLPDALLSYEGCAKDEEFVRALREHPSQWLDGFVTDEDVCRLGQRVGKRTLASAEGSFRGNNKLMLHRYFEAQGEPVFATEYAADAEEVRGCLRTLRGLGFREAAVKAQVGASGIGIERMRTDGDGVVEPYMFHEGTCMVQGWLEPGLFGIERVLSPSVQLFLGDGRVTLYDLTLQLLSDASVHEGNVAPPEEVMEVEGLAEELLRQAEVAGCWLHEQGYRGTASVDFLVVWRGSEFTVYICEINARVTGATYPAVLARHFQRDGAWLMRNVVAAQPVRPQAMLDQLRQQGCLFVPGKERGVVPINLNMNRERMVKKGQFLCLGPRVEDCLEMQERLCEALVESSYDRD